MENIDSKLNKRSVDNLFKKNQKRVQWFFDGEEHIFSKKEEDFIKKVAPRFFKTFKN